MLLIGQGNIRGILGLFGSEFAYVRYAPKWHSAHCGLDADATGSYCAGRRTCHTSRVEGASNRRRRAGVAVLVFGLARSYAGCGLTQDFPPVLSRQTKRHNTAVTRSGEASIVAKAALRFLREAGGDMSADSGRPLAPFPTAVAALPTNARKTNNRKAKIKVLCGGGERRRKRKTTKAQDSLGLGHKAMNTEAQQAFKSALHWQKKSDENILAYVEMKLQWLKLHV